MAKKNPKSTDTGGNKMGKRTFDSWDLMVFCDHCQRSFLEGCEEHPPEFKSPTESMDKVEVRKSFIPNAGRGVINISLVTFPVGVLFGPYIGKYEINEDLCEHYWAIKTWNGSDRFVSAGPKPDPKEQWMSFVNCPNTEEQQNLFVCQFKSNIYYRVVRPIPPGAELLVYYGDQYAKKLGVCPFKTKGLGLKSSPEKLIRQIKTDLESEKRATKDLKLKLVNSNGVLKANKSELAKVQLECEISLAKNLQFEKVIEELEQKCQRQQEEICLQSRLRDESNIVAQNRRVTEKFESDLSLAKAEISALKKKEDKSLVVKIFNLNLRLRQELTKNKYLFDRLTEKLAVIEAQQKKLKIRDDVISSLEKNLEERVRHFDRVKLDLYDQAQQSVRQKKSLSNKIRILLNERDRQEDVLDCLLKKRNLEIEGLRVDLLNRDGCIERLSKEKERLKRLQCDKEARKASGDARQNLVESSSYKNRVELSVENSKNDGHSRSDDKNNNCSENDDNQYSDASDNDAEDSDSTLLARPSRKQPADDQSPYDCQNSIKPIPVANQVKSRGNLNNESNKKYAEQADKDLEDQYSDDLDSDQENLVPEVSNGKVILAAARPKNLSKNRNCRYCQNTFFDTSTRNKHESFHCSKNPNKKPSKCGKSLAGVPAGHRHVALCCSKNPKKKCRSCHMVCTKVQGHEKYHCPLQLNRKRCCQYCQQPFYRPGGHKHKCLMRPGGPKQIETAASIISPAGTYEIRPTTNSDLVKKPTNAKQQAHAHIGSSVENAEASESDEDSLFYSARGPELVMSADVRPLNASMKRRRLI